MTGTTDRTAPGTALLLVDVQNDFFPGGALPVPCAEEILPVANRSLAYAFAAGWTIYASRDWHPARTTHFETDGGPWPVHCVQGTAGARFHADLRLPPEAIVISKGDAADSDGYSDFEGHTPDGVPFLADLRRRSIARLFVGGLATDYCVKHTVLDACHLGLRVTLLTDATRGVEVATGDTEDALAAMRTAGAELADFDHLGEPR